MLDDCRPRDGIACHSGCRANLSLLSAWHYLDGTLKKDSDAAVKAKYMKSYKILRAIDDDDTSWNMLLLREYDSLASIEANEEKADALSRQVLGEDDTKQMQGYDNRLKARQILGTKTMRELILK